MLKNAKGIRHTNINGQDKLNTARTGEESKIGE